MNNLHSSVASSKSKLLLGTPSYALTLRSGDLRNYTSRRHLIVCTVFNLLYSRIEGSPNFMSSKCFDCDTQTVSYVALAFGIS